MNVFTGETGAGKSILLDCISFVLGFRGRSNYARRGADYGEVIATFELPPDHKIWQKFEDAGFENFDYELVFKRKSFRDGKKIAFINEKRCSNQILREFSRLMYGEKERIKVSLFNDKEYLKSLEILNSDKYYEILGY